MGYGGCERSQTPSPLSIEKICLKLTGPKGHPRSQGLEKKMAMALKKAEKAADKLAPWTGADALPVLQKSPKKKGQLKKVKK